MRVKKFLDTKRKAKSFLVIEEFSEPREFPYKKKTFGAKEVCVSKSFQILENLRSRENFPIKINFRDYRSYAF